MQYAGYLTAAVATLSAAYVSYKYLTRPYHSYDDATHFFRGKCVWVTGASSGIGKALAIELFRAGAQVCLTGRNAATLQAVVDEDLAAVRTSHSIDPFIIPLDIGEVAHNRELADEAVAKALHSSISGKIDVMIHNAGVSVRGSSLTMQTSVDQSIFDVNVFGPVALTRALFAKNALAPGSNVCAITSVQAKLPIAFRGAYAGSKHALQAYLDSMRLELENYGISVTTILPGYVATSLSKNALTADGSKYNMMDANTASGLPAQTVAQKTLFAIACGEPEVWLAPFSSRAAMLLYNVTPDLIRQFLRSKAKKEMHTNVPTPAAPVAATPSSASS